MIPSDILPEPFYWIAIPAGQVTLKEWRGGGEERTVDVSAFQIAQYPITNTQYAQFIKAGGYTTQSYWTDDGWKLLQKHKWTAPHNWREQSPCDDCPAVGLSWYEAMAFCMWLSETSSETITLPTEAQWQRAAQGDDGRDYPWGNEYDKENFNHFDSQIRKPTPVQKYAGRNNSPYGVIDMAGNCWEWCLDKWEPVGKHEQRALRGGSSINTRRFSQTHWRNALFSDERFLDLSLRVVRTMP